MKKVNINIRITILVFLLFTPASLGESSKPDSFSCEGELVLLHKLQVVKTPWALRAEVLEAKKLLVKKSERLELSRIAQASKKASTSDVPALKSRLVALLEEKCIDKD